MKERGGPFTRLLDLHTLIYEEQTYPNYTPISEENARKNCRAIWRWINAALPSDAPGAQPHRVEECFFMLFGERNHPAVVARTWCDPGCREPSITTHTVPGQADPATVLETWLRDESPLPGIELRSGARNKVVTFYLLYQSEPQVKKLSDFLSRPSFLASGDLLVGQSGNTKTVREILSRPPGQSFYQRLCVVFGCADEAAAQRLKPLAKQIVCGLITTWGGAIDRANERAKAAQMEAQAWSHEMGNFIRYLSWEEKNESRHLYDLTMNFLEIGTRATVTLQTLPEVIKHWPQLKTDRMLNEAIDLSTRFAVLRDFRGSHQEIKTIDGLEDKVDLFKLRFAEPKVPERRLRLAGGSAHPELNQKLAAFAQFVIFALYSAARHSKEPGLIEVSLAKDRFTVRNPAPPPAAGGGPKSEVKAILHQAYQVLWDGAREDFTCGNVDGVWITDCDLPEGLWEKRDEKADRLLH